MTKFWIQLKRHEWKTIHSIFINVSASSFQLVASVNFRLNGKLSLEGFKIQANVHVYIQCTFLFDNFIKFEAKLYVFIIQIAKCEKFVYSKLRTANSIRNMKKQKKTQPQKYRSYSNLKLNMKSKIPPNKWLSTVDHATLTK